MLGGDRRLARRQLLMLGLRLRLESLALSAQDRKGLLDLADHTEADLFSRAQRRLALRLGCLVLPAAALNGLLEASLASRKLRVLLRLGAVFLSKLSLKPVEHFPRRAEDGLPASCN